MDNILEDNIPEKKKVKIRYQLIHSYGHSLPTHITVTGGLYTKR